MNKENLAKRLNQHLVKIYGESSSSEEITVLTDNIVNYLADAKDEIFKDDKIDHNYEELSFTTILKHSFNENNVARQIFLNDGIIAFLPISNFKTSIVWSKKNSFSHKLKKEKFSSPKKQMSMYAKNFYKNIKFISKIESNSLNLLIRNSFYKNR